MYYTLYTMLAEVFFGTAIEIRTFFTKKYCIMHRLPEDRWRMLPPSVLNDIRIKNTTTGKTMVFWAGSSGTNFMAVDKTGGCHNFDGDGSVYEVLV